MKIVALLICYLFSFQVLADCPQVSGKYICSEDLEDDLLFGGGQLEIKETKFFDYKMFITKTAKAQVTFPFNDWMPYMNDLNEEFLYDVGTSSECREDKLSLKLKILPPEGEEGEEPFIITYQVSKLNKGISIDVFMEDIHAFSTNCELQ